MNKIKIESLNINKKNGFTVIEVLVALSILVIAATCFLPLFVYSYRDVFRSGNKSGATYGAQSEAVRVLAADNITTGIEDLPINFGTIIHMKGAMVALPAVTVGNASSSLKVFLPTVVVNVSPNPDYLMYHALSTNTNIAVQLTTRNVNDGTSVTASFINKDGTSVSGVIPDTQIVNGNFCLLNLNIPYTTAVGDYIIRVQVTGISKNYDIKYTIQVPRFVAVGNGGAINASVYGVTWYDRNLTSEPNLNAITYGDNKYMAVGYGNQVYYTQDGFNWLSSSLDTSYNLYNLNDVVFNGNSFISVGDSGTIFSSSDDGVSWSKMVSTTTNHLRSIVWSGSKFVAVGDNTTIISSDTGSTWSYTGVTWSDPDAVAAVTGLDAADSLVSIDYGEDNYYAVTSSGKMIKSSDSIIWGTVGASNLSTLAASAETTINKIKWCGDKIFALGNKGFIATSTDGETWTTQTSGTSSNLKSIIFGDTRYEIAGSNVILSSSDGTTWTAVTSSSYFNGIASSK